MYNVVMMCLFYSCVRVMIFTFFENYISNVSVRVLGQEMVAHSKGKLNSLWKGLFRDVGGSMQLGM